MQGLYPNGTFSWESQNWDTHCPKTLGVHIFFKTNVFGACEGIFYIPQNDFSNGVLHALIRDHLTPTLKGFVLESQIPNLTPNHSFDHNSCILGLNEQCEGTLGIYTSRPL